MQILVLLGSLLAAGETWSVGFGKADITPKYPMWMSGYAARSKPAEGTYSPLQATVATFGVGARIDLVVVALDLVGVDRETADELISAIAKRLPDLPRSAVVLNCSHTHCGPVVRGNLAVMYALDETQSAFVTRYSIDLRAGVAAALDAALADRKPAVLSYGVGTCTVAVNRRANPEKNVPMLRAENKLSGPSDPRVPVLAVRTPAGELRGVLFGYACHATTLDFYRWCADYPGFARTALEKRHPGCTSLFLAGCGGDQNPLPRRKPELAERYGAALADAVDETLRKPTTSLPPNRIAARLERIPLAYKEIPTRAQLDVAVGSPNKYEAARARLLLRELDNRGRIAESYPYPVQTVRFGPLAWALLGGEVTVDYALGVEKEFGPNVWTFGYSNDVMAYVPSERVLNEGGYEGGGAMVYYGLPSPWKSGVERNVRAAITDQLGDFAGARR